MERKIFDVTQVKGRWAVKPRGAGQGSTSYPDKKEAVERGIEMAKRSRPAQLIIHKSDGGIAEERSYQADPLPRQA